MDFMDKLRFRVGSDEKGCFNVASIFKIDKIKTNKKYYYIFRTIDIHGLVSNPTPVYELELIDDGTTVVPKVRIVDFNRLEKIYAKKMRKYIQIVPTVAQTAFNEAESSDLHMNTKNSNVVLGKVEDRLFSQESDSRPKKFKIRVTSRKTGRKIDLNVVFKHKRIRNIPCKDLYATRYNQATITGEGIGSGGTSTPGQTNTGESMGEGGSGY
jgi:hypothetical protein